MKGVLLIITLDNRHKSGSSQKNQDRWSAPSRAERRGWMSRSLGPFPSPPGPSNEKFPLFPYFKPQDSMYMFTWKQHNGHLLILPALHQFPLLLVPVSQFPLGKTTSTPLHIIHYWSVPTPGIKTSSKPGQAGHSILLITMIGCSMSIWVRRA